MNNFLKKQGESFQEGFYFGLEFSRTISNNLSFNEIQKRYEIHKSTSLSWSKIDFFDIKDGYKRMMYEYIRSLNEQETQKFMSKYNLPKDNTIETITEAFLMNVDDMYKMKDSAVAWKGILIDKIMSINKELFSKQIETIKRALSIEVLQDDGVFDETR